MKLRYTLLTSLLLTSCLAVAQQELSLHFMSDIVQSSFTNPAIGNPPDDHQLSVSLPSIAFNFGNSGFTYNNIIRKRKEDDSLIVNVNHVISKLARQNHIFVHANLDILHINFRYKRWLIGASITDRTSVNIKYPKSLISILWQGNAQYFQQSKDIGLAVNANRYIEHGLRLSYLVSPKYKIGGRIKYLNGIANINTQASNLNVYTDSIDYGINIDSRYLIQMSNTESFSALQIPYTSDGGNNGMAIDIGVVRTLNDKITISTSLNDIGFINWKKNVENFENNGDYTFNGVDLSTYLLSDTLSLASYLDTLGSVFGFTTNNNKYRTYLVPKFYLSGKYKKDNNSYYGAILYGELFNGIHPALSITYNKKYNDIFKSHIDYSLGFSYSYKNRSFYNFGFSSIIQWKSLQVYVVGDNIISWLLPKAIIPLKELYPLYPTDHEGTITIPKNLKNFNLRFGINLVF